MTTLAIMQGGGPTPVINASLAGVLSAVAKSTAINKVYGLVHSLENHDWLDLSQLNDSDIARLANTPGALLGSSRRPVTDTALATTVEQFRRQDIHDFIAIGGNGTMQLCLLLANYAKTMNYPLSIVAVPKTMDNDLAGTDHAPGFGSAARFVATVTRDVGLDLEAMATFDDVILFEVMGRHSGWVAAAAGLAKITPEDAPHLIYVPEQAFDEDQFFLDIQKVHKNYGRAFVVLSEGLVDKRGDMIGADSIDGPRDELGRVIYSLSSGIGNYLSQTIQRQLGLQSRCLRPTLMGRSLSSCVSSQDHQEAYRAGEMAVAALLTGHSEVMVSLVRQGQVNYCCDFGLVSLSTVAGVEKLLPAHYLAGSGTMVNDAFRNYARPLLGEPLPAYLYRSELVAGDRVHGMTR